MTDLEALEQLAFGSDRAAALATLLPGSVLHDYWRGVFLQHDGHLQEVDAILASWQQRHGHGHDAHHERLRRRQLLLRADADLAATTADLQREMGVVLDDRAEVVVQAQRYPTQLAPALIDERTLLRDELRRRPDLSTITDSALPDILPSLTPNDAKQRHSLLQRLKVANIPGLVDLVVADLAEKGSAGFGSVGVHAHLTLPQLEELATRRPALSSEAAWVDAVLVRLRPPSWTEVRIDAAERRAFLDRLWAFVSRLGPIFNSLKAEVLLRWLAHDRAAGVFDRARFIAYLELPRHVHRVSPDWLKRAPSEHHVQLGIYGSHVTGLDRVDDDESLVLDHLAHFLRDEDGSAFSQWLRPEWLEEQLAITRLLDARTTSAEAERWAKVLGPERVASLRDRVDIDLAPQNPIAFRADDDIALEVDVKNVRELEVKVFRIDTLSYFLARGAEVDTSLDLDGMMPSGEPRVLRFDAPPLHRARQRVELPMCKRPGTYIVELIGNGRSSRALIRKGALRHSVRIGAAGLVLTIMDEDGVPLRDARLWLGGRELAARADADPTAIPTITIPFSTRPGPANILLVHGDVTARATITHLSEHVHLSAGLHLERESLVPNQTARVICRPSLTVTGAPASLALLEEPRFDITVTDLAGTTTSRTQSVSLHDDAETVLELNVPDGITRLAVRLRGRVRLVSTQQTVDVASDASTSVNTIHTTEQTETVHFVRTQRDDVKSHELLLLGKTGEPLAERAVSIALTHRSTSTAVTTTLETSEHGVITLGPLAGIETITATVASGTHRTWSLSLPPVLPTALHALADDEILVPVPEDTRPEDLLLVELRGDASAHDVTTRLSVVDRCATMRLAAGEYRFTGRFLPRGGLKITVAPRGGATNGWAVVGQAMFELTPPLPLVRALAADGDAIVLRLSGTRPDTRVHLVATRFDADNALTSIAANRWKPSSLRSTVLTARYLSGRDIGDEYRYVLERRTAARRPGTMLEKPSLLLNPWALRTTSTGRQMAMAGGAYAAAPAAAAGPGFDGEAKRKMMNASADDSEDPGFPSMDFLAQGAVVIENLRPDADGCVRVPLADLGSAQLVQAIVVDPLFSSRAELVLAPRPAAARDLRLRLALDPVHHYAEDRGVVPAPAGTAFVVPDVRTGKLELIDTLGRAHQLLQTLMDNADLRELSFVTEWSSLDEKTRRARYSQYACHELHLFLWRKDKAFFETVVRPYLAHKRDKTFVDRFLLDEDLSSFLEPWAFGRLNTVERILLALRHPAVRDAMARLVGDAVDVLPHDPERDARLLATLLGASSLERSSPAAAMMADELSEAEYDGAEMQKERSAGAPAAPPARAKKMASLGGRGGGGSSEGLARDLAERDRAEPLYRGADKTQELAETGWWRRRVSESNAELIRPNRFWRDLARHALGKSEAPFLSPHLGDSTSSFAEAMCALAFLDLPFRAAVHDTKLEEMSLTVTPQSHALAARTHIVAIAAVDEGEKTPSSASVLIGQSYFRSDDRWEWDGSEQHEKYVTGEMIAGVVYRCQVVVTNPTSRQQKLDLLLQIPRGAVPVASGFFTRTLNLQLSPYGTESIEYAFYFPRPGRFSHFPAHVTKNLVLQAAAEAREIEVVSRPTQADLGSWSHVSQHGSLDDVLGFLERANLQRTDLGRIAWRMHDRTAFERVTALLRARHVFDARLWRYSFAHNDRPRLGEWLRHESDFLEQAGPALSTGHGEGTPLVAFDALERGWYQHLEYAPLINARAHQLGARRQILNDALAQQYRSFLELVAHRSRAGADDLLAAASYLLCMDRVDEALAMLDRVPPASTDSARLQQDYLRAYSACYRGDLTLARRLAAPWAEHPVDRWRNRFASLIAMLDDVEGGARKVDSPVVRDRDSRTERLTESAKRQPALELSAAGHEIILQHHNLASCQLRFFRMDIELVFSRQPFVQGDVERFSFIEPGLVLEVPLAGDESSGRTVVAVPADLRGANLVIEAVAPNIRTSIAHYAHDLGLQLAHAYGQVRVLRASTQAPLPATYVKVYGRQKNGQTSFFKDGYTDLRGSFDYATLSTDDLDRVDRLALLIVSDDAGATIIEAPPPPR